MVIESHAFELALVYPSKASDPRGRVTRWRLLHRVQDGPPAAGADRWAGGTSCYSTTKYLPAFRWSTFASDVRARAATWFSSVVGCRYHAWLQLRPATGRAGCLGQPGSDFPGLAWAPVFNPKLGGLGLSGAFVAAAHIRELPDRTSPVESSATVAVFPSMKAGKFLAVLARDPLGYEVTRQSGSHRTLEADGRPKLLFSYHDRADVPPGVIRKYLVKEIGLSEAKALELLRG